MGEASPADVARAGIDLDVFRTLVDEASHYAGPTDDDNQQLWDAIDPAEDELRRIDNEQVPPPFVISVTGENTWVITAPGYGTPEFYQIEFDHDADVGRRAAHVERDGPIGDDCAGPVDSGDHPARQPGQHELDWPVRAVGDRNLATVRFEQGMPAGDLSRLQAIL